MDDELEQGQDPVAAALAALRAKQGKPASPNVEDALAALRGRGGPITPGHSKFSPEELSARADASVQQAHDETMDAQGNLIKTLQLPGELYLGGKVGNEATSGKLAQSVPALLRGGGNVLKAVKGRAGTTIDVLRLAAGNPRPLARRFVRGLADVTGEGLKAPKSPFPTPAPVTSAVEGVQAGSGSLRRKALERQFQNVVDEGKAGYDASLHKGTPIGEPPTNWDLMQRMEAGLLKAKGKGAPRVPAWRRAAGLP